MTILPLLSWIYFLIAAIAAGSFGQFDVAEVLLLACIYLRLASAIRNGAI